MSNSNALNNYMPYILDANGNLILNFVNISNAVNFVNIYNNATGSAPVIQGAGTDPNVTLNLQGTGTGGVQVQGTGTNTDATPTFVGEYISNQVVSGSAFSIASGVITNITSISLTAGDWDVSGVAFLTATGGTGTFGGASACINTSSAVFTDASLVTSAQGASTSFFTTLGLSVANRRISIPSTTSVFLIIDTNSYGAGVTVLGSGFIGARRIR